MYDEFLNDHFPERERFSTSIQPAWLLRAILCSYQGLLQQSNDAMASRLLVIVQDIIIAPSVFIANLSWNTCGITCATIQTFHLILWGGLLSTAIPAVVASKHKGPAGSLS